MVQNSARHPVDAKQIMDALARFQVEPCLPPRWAQTGHAQTIIAHCWPQSHQEMTGETPEILDLPDGEQLAILHTPGRDVVVSLFHGLGGSADSDYLRRAACLAHRRGFAVIRANHRGCGVGEGLALKPYHSGRAEDLSAVLQWARARYPKAFHLAIGFSLSGNCLLLLQAGVRGSVRPDLGISVNAPIDLAQAAYSLADGLNRIYDLRFVNLFLWTMARWRRMGIKRTQYAIWPWSRLRDIDRVYTAPEGGFRDPEDYYATCSTVGLLTHIEKPTLLLMSEDDPMIDAGLYKTAKRSEYVALHLEACGGHMGYFNRLRGAGSSRFWLDHFFSRCYGMVAELVAGVSRMDLRN